jgi:hypothetical protein
MTKARRLMNLVVLSCAVLVLYERGSADWQTEQQQLNNSRAAYWAQQGYRFDPQSTSAWEMDQKVRDIQRAAYWAAWRQAVADHRRDQKVRDIQRAAYWAAWRQAVADHRRDQKVRDIQRAAYWAQQGYHFDPQSTPAWEMDLIAGRVRTPGGESPAVRQPSSSLPASVHWDTRYRPLQAENGDLYNVDNDGDGRVEPIYVNGYYRSDGTYVRSHYRARP